MLDKNAKIYVAGHRGLVGSAIWKNLEEKGYTNLIGKTHTELDLLDGVAVRRFFDEEQPEYVFLAAAFVGGIMANSIYRADFIYKNLQIQQNVIGESFRHGVKKLLFLGSTCIYPRDAEQPMKEDALLTSPLEYTNEPYAIAKIAGLKMCESFNLQYGTNYIAVMPTNLYGPNDNFDLERSHVLPAMIRKIHLAHCLKQGDWDAVRHDMNLRPVEGINGDSSKEDILKTLLNTDHTMVDMQRSIEAMCLSLLTRQQPVARDMRLVSAALKVVPDIERIGDHVADIVELYLRMGNMNPEGKQEHLLLEMMEEAKEMIHNSVEAFVEGDEANARKVVEHDDMVDDLFNEVKTEMMQAIREQNLDADRVVDYLMMAKYLEKVGDHAVNIAQWAIFRMTGDMEGVKLY